MLKIDDAPSRRQCVTYKIDDAYRIFLDHLDDLDVFETQYQCIQHYKHYMMKQLSESYDEVLYLDLDVFINTHENIFEKCKSFSVMLLIVFSF